MEDFGQRDLDISRPYMLRNIGSSQEMAASTSNDYRSYLFFALGEFQQVCPLNFRNVRLSFRWEMLRDVVQLSFAGSARRLDLMRVDSRIELATDVKVQE